MFSLGLCGAWCLFLKRCLRLIDLAFRASRLTVPPAGARNRLLSRSLVDPKALVVCVSGCFGVGIEFSGKPGNKRQREREREQQNRATRSFKPQNPTRFKVSPPPSPKLKRPP